MAVLSVLNMLTLQISLAILIILLPSPTACSLWFLSQMKMSALGGEAATGVKQPTTSICDLALGLSKNQRKLCARHPAVMEAVRAGADNAIRECQKQFLNKRWNCSTMANTAPGGGRVLLKPGTREAAFVYAIASAGVLQALSKACSQGSLKECSCGRNLVGGGKDKEGEFQWQGCSDNVRFASKFSRRFVDAPEKKTRDPVALMNLHNNRAGRKAVRKLLTKKCKCHGLSGACSMRTCWQTAPEFSRLGVYLEQLYHKAVQVTTHQSKAAFAAVTPTVRQLDDAIDAAILPKASLREVRQQDLVFFEASPDYCVYDQQTGSPGTSGRQCNRTTGSSDSCDVLCCGRGYDTTTQVQTVQCECRFVWCCEVQCKTCTVTEEIHTCKPHVYAPYEELYRRLDPAHFYRRRFYDERS